MTKNNVYDPSRRGNSRDSISSLLRLPPAIRRQIYLEAGVNTGQRIDLTFRVLEHQNHHGYFLHHGFYNFLFICRTIYTEISHVIYSENSFIVQHRDPRKNLEAVRNLTAVSVSALKSLTVHLNGAPCCLHGCCGRYTNVYGTSCSDRGHKESLATSVPSDQAVLEEWRRTVDYITAHAKSSNLELYLIAHVHDHETALQVVDPILSFARLRRCVIRLGHDPDPILEKLAEETALRATGHQVDESGLRFRFLDLPQEIRDQVLQYTEPVTPIKEVMWNPKDGYSVCYCISSFDEEAEAFFGEDSAIRHSFKFRNCWATAGVGCFCRRFHAVSSSMCHCWFPPRSLFLMCRDILNDARKIFFSKNRFIITSSKGPNVIAEGTPQRLEASVFLTNVVPFTSLRWLRSVELVFPPFEEDYLRATDPAYSGWLQTIDHVKKELCIPMLNLHVHIADPQTDNGSVVGGLTYRPNLRKEQAQIILAMYMRTLKTLPPLDKFKSFTMHLVMPWGWDQTGYHRSKRNHETMEAYEKRRMHMEKVVGRSIVGEYIDQVLTNSNARSDSQWLELTWTRYEQTIG